MKHYAATSKRLYPPPPVHPGEGGGRGVLAKLKIKRLGFGRGRSLGIAGARGGGVGAPKLSARVLSARDCLVATGNLESGFHHCATARLSSRRSPVDLIHWIKSPATASLRPDLAHSHSMVNGFEFTLKLLGFPRVLQVHTNCDTTGVRALDSWILYCDLSRHKRANIINERCENADQTSPTVRGGTSTRLSLDHDRYAFAIARRKGRFLRNSGRACLSVP
jgi:hypothetical protein